MEIDFRKVFSDPIYTYKRKGTADDPFIKYTDRLHISQNRVTLRELPSREEGVKATVGSGNFYVIEEGVPEKDTIFVDYVTGEIFFHSSHNGKPVTVTYMGTGIKLISDDRIYTEMENGKPSETLKQVVGNTKKQSEDLKKTIDNNKKVIEDNNRIRHEAQVAMSEYKRILDNTHIIPKDPVKDMNELYSKYPRPQVGWTVQVENPKRVRRWDGHEWGVIFNLEKYEGFNVEISPDSPFYIYAVWGVPTEKGYIPSTMRVKHSKVEPFPTQVWAKQID